RDAWSVQHLITDADAERRPKVEIAEAIAREDRVAVEEEPRREEARVLAAARPFAPGLLSGVLSVFERPVCGIAVAPGPGHDVAVEPQAVDVCISRGGHEARVGA